MNEWRRDFPAERVNRFSRVLHALRGGAVKPDRAFSLVGEFFQSQFIDTNLYYRVGGLDGDKAKENSNPLAIQWGIGSNKAATFEDQVSIANEQEIKYFTWAILDVDSIYSIDDQIEMWHGTPGATEAPMVIDQEKPRSGTRYLNATELIGAVNKIRDLSTFGPGCYSRVNIFEDVFSSSFPQEFEDVWQWIAQYLLHWDGSNWVQYKYFDDFVMDWQWNLPPSVTSSHLYSDEKWRNMVWAWQFSDKGDAEYYIAPEWIEPGQPGIKSCDLNLSIKSHPLFMLDVFGETVPEPEPDPELEERVTALELRVDELEKSTLKNGDIVKLEK